MAQSSMTNLIGACDLQSVEDGDIDVGSPGHHQQVANTNVEIHGGVLEHLHWRPQQRNGWHETGHQWQGHWKYLKRRQLVDDIDLCIIIQQQQYLITLTLGQTITARVR